MIQKILIGVGFLCFLCFVACQQEATTVVETSKDFEFKEKLSEYQLFQGKLVDLKPNKNVIPYELNTPLFTDYAHKARFIKLPEGANMDFKGGEVEYPIGTMLIKNFFYYNDERNFAKGRKIIETRVLVKEDDNWVVANYEWNDAQTEANRNFLGGKKQYEWIDKEGQTRQVNYVIPDNNDCKSCHKKNALITPIGPKAKNLNRTIAINGQVENQLLHWREKGFLKNLIDIRKVTKLTAWDNIDAKLGDRAMAYLDVNCAHCHSKFGPATNTGLFLNSEEKSPHRIGVYKGPVSAAQGSGNLKYNIVPGDAANSIIVYRLNSTETGIAMPEIGRSLVHKEGVQLITDWINQMEKS